MIVTDAEKLQQVREYVEQMSPIVRIALYVDDEQEAYNRGYDEACHYAQQDLLEILNG